MIDFYLSVRWMVGTSLFKLARRIMDTDTALHPRRFVFGACVARRALRIKERVLKEKHRRMTPQQRQLYEFLFGTEHANGGQP